MPARRLLIGALLTGIVVPGRPAAIAAQRSIDLPLRDTRTLVVVDAWEGYSPISPITATYTLQRSADGSFAGTARITVGAGLLRRDTSFAVRLPRGAVDSVLQVLSEAPLREGGYAPTFTHTDDYPSITADLTVGDSVIRFHTTSQGRAHVPWRVSAGGRTYASGSEAIWPALGAVLGRMAGREKQALIEAARADPEAQCGRGGYGPRLTFAQRPRFAAGEPWFVRDSSITDEGRRYRKYGLPRIVGLHEVDLHATYRGVPVLREIGVEGTPEILYVPVRASCEVQPYALEPRP
jgi:hypothetical protein